MNILVHFSAIPERLVGMLVLGPKDVDSIGRLKNVYLVLIAESLHTASACRRCPLHVRGYYVTQYYDRLRRERTYVGQSYASQFYDRLRSEI